MCMQLKQNTLIKQIRDYNYKFDFHTLAKNTIFEL